MQTEPQQKSELDDTRDKMSLVDVAMVAYQAPSGELRSEPLQTARMDKEGNLWFFIGADRPLVAAIARNPHINLVYVSEREGIYISVGGSARVLHNSDLQQVLWHGKLKRWFRQGPDSQDVRLLKVAITYCEYWDEPRSNLFRMLLKAVNAAAEGEDVGPAHRQVSVSGHTQADHPRH
jgi:general stress protein 26